MFKALNDLLVPDFSELFQLNESLYGLRSNGPQKLCIPNISSVRFGKGLVHYFGPVIWNSIPAKIRNAKTFFQEKNSKMDAIKLSTSTLCRLFGWNWFYKH